MHNIDHNGINANFVLPYICNFLFFAPCGTSKCEIKYPWVLDVFILKVKSSLILFIPNGRAKIKLAMLQFLSWREFVKTFAGMVRH